MDGLPAVLGRSAQVEARVPSALPPQPLDHVQVAIDRRIVQRLPAVAVLRAHVLALGRAHQPLHELEVALVRGHVDGLVAVGGARAQVGAARAEEARDLVRVRVRVRVSSP